MTRIDDLNELLQKLTDLREELRAVTSEANAARHALRDDHRRYKMEVESAIEAAVMTQMQALSKKVRDDAESLILEEMERLVGDWRRALRIDP